MSEFKEKKTVGSAMQKNLQCDGKKSAVRCRKKIGSAMDGFGAFYGKALERVMRCGPESKDLRDNVKFLANIKCFQYNQKSFSYRIHVFAFSKL